MATIVIDWNVTAAVSSAIAAVASFFVALVLGRRAEAIAAAQRRHSAFSTAAEWRRDLMSWASEGIDVLTEIAYYCEENDAGDVGSRIIASRSRLSALI